MLGTGREKLQQAEQRGGRIADRHDRAFEMRTPQFDGGSRARRALCGGDFGDLGILQCADDRVLRRQSVADEYAKQRREMLQFWSDYLDRLAPAADFSASPTGLFAGIPVLFVDTSGNSPTSWAWNFGDPASGAANTSTSKNPRHTYSAPGVYTITLIVGNSVGSNQITHTVTVSAGGPCKRCSRVTPFR